MRAALNDPGKVGAYQWKDEQLSAALRTVVQTGIGPKGVLLDETGENLSPEPATPDARGWLVFQACLLLIGGSSPVSFRTRPMSVTVDARERMETIAHFRRTLHDLLYNGDPHGTGNSSFFGLWADFENHICRRTEPERLA